MRLESTAPSFTKTSHDMTDNKPIQWQKEIDYNVGFSILEKEFYPFKEVWYSFVTCSWKIGAVDMRSRVE